MDWEREGEDLRMEVVPMVFMLPLEWLCGCDMGRVVERPMMAVLSRWTLSYYGYGFGFGKVRSVERK